jgi:hypothetical protein
MDTASALKIAAAIQVQEGWNPSTLSFRNNNPGNLRYAGQAGAVQGAGGYAAFPTYDAGLNALVGQIQLDASRGTDAAGRPVVTVEDLISSWAPPNENDTPAYVASVVSQTGFAAGSVLNDLGSSAGAMDSGGDSAYTGDDQTDTTGGPGAISATTLAAAGVAVGAVLWLAIAR